jgi:ABC-2 type transport system ATP-binding protein
VDKGKIIFDGDFAALLETASPNKIIKLQLERPVPDLASYGQISYLEGLNAHLSIARNEVSSRAAQLLAALPIADITIEDPPIEDVIGQLFVGGK